MNSNSAPVKPLQENRQWLLLELQMVDYTEALDLQHRLVSARKDRIIPTDIALFLEHPPVFTLGRRGDLDNLMVPEDFLEKQGISVIRVERGGDITYHGPGQLVVYPIISLREAGLSVVDYVTNLEEVMLQTAADWGIKADRNPANRGIWVGQSKLGSIGVAIRHQVSFHGLAFNVGLSLKPFSWINPCGLQNVGITSMERELSRKIPMDQVREATKRHMEEVFGVELVSTPLPEVEKLLRKSS